MRLACVLVMLATATAGATSLPSRMGMYPSTSAPLPMVDSKMSVSVRGPMVEATVAQTFRNDSDRTVEATYIFPLPPDAAVSAMAIDYGSRTIHASIVRRADAQRRYEEAVAAGLGAGLLDQERADVFTQTVSAIPPHAKITVTLRYDTVARYEAGTWQLALPMVVAPRYVPGTASGRPTTGTGHAPDTDRAPDASRVTPAASPGAGGRTEVVLELADAVDDVTSPTHELKKQGASYVLVDEHSDHDAIVRWKGKLPDEGWVEQDDDGGYAAVMVAAPAAGARTKEVRAVLLVDRAATTRGDAEAIERPVVRALLAALSARDRVALVAGDYQAPEQALRALEQGWKAPPGVFDLTKVLAQTHAKGAAVVLVTDGLVADDRAALAAAKQVGGPIHVIGVGPAPNRALLQAIASATGGTIRYAVIDDDLAALAQQTVADVASAPAPLQVTWGTLAAREVVPAQLPRLGAGQAMLVVARVDRAHAANARARGDVFAFGTVDVRKPPEGATTPKGPLARRWARMKLDELIAANQPGAIAAHALRYGLVSPMTSMIAIGDEVVVQGGVKHTVPVPVSVPAGMEWQTVKRELAVDTTALRDKDQIEGKRPAGHAAKGGEATATKTADNRPAKRPPHPAHRPPVQNAPPVQHAPPVEEPIAAPSPAPVPPPVAARPESPKRAHRDEADDDEGRESDKSETRAPEAPPEAQGGVATGADYRGLSMESEETIAVESASPLSQRRLRFSLALGAAREAGVTSALVAPRASFEVGGRTKLGVEGSLWLVDGVTSVEGTLLGMVDRVGVLRRLDLAGGLGLHLGNGLGPAGALELRYRLPLRHVAGYLRYDGALLLHDSTRDGQNAGTLGIEASF
ncbi:MAG: VIT domain-containing protein [Acidobacteriota bacterium]